MSTAPTVMELCSNALRGMIVAPPGKKLVVSDLLNIEGRKGAWLAREEWKVQAFRDFDAGTGPDTYKLAYSHPFKVSPDEVTSFQRQMGKGMELSMLFGGGVGAFIGVSAQYKLDLDAMTESAWDLLPQENKAKGFQTWQWASKKNKTLGLRREVYVTCDVLKQLWRESHSNIDQTWGEVENAFRQATLHPGQVYRAARCKFVRTGNWLRIRLPSGRELCYASPQVGERGALSYMGLNQYTRKWQRLKTYGGKLFENITQASARDVMMRAMPRVEAAGYKIILTVHDELVTETPDTAEFSVDVLNDLLAQGEPWTEGLPITASGEEMYRYRKAD